MSWLRELGIFGGAAAGVALLVAVAAVRSAALGVSAEAPTSPILPVAPSSRVASSPTSAGGNAGSWAHGFIGQIGTTLTAKVSHPVLSGAPSSPASSIPPLDPPPRPAALAAVPTPVVAAVTTPPMVSATSSVLGGTVPGEVRRWEPYIVKYASEYRLDPNLVAAVMMTESGGNPQATSRKGAIGLMQVVGGDYDPEQNVAQGTRILAADLQRFGGNLELTLAAYNAGAGAVDRYQGIPPFFETETYVYLVLNRYYLYSPSG